MSILSRLIRTPISKKQRELTRQAKDAERVRAEAESGYRIKTQRFIDQIRSDQKN